VHTAEVPSGGRPSQPSLGVWGARDRRVFAAPRAPRCSRHSVTAASTDLVLASGVRGASSRPREAPKGCVESAATVTVTRNEILYALNKPDDFIMAIVELGKDGAHRIHYSLGPFRREPDFGVTSVNYDLAELPARAGEPQ